MFAPKRDDLSRRIRELEAEVEKLKKLDKKTVKMAAGLLMDSEESEADNARLRAKVRELREQYVETLRGADDLAHKLRCVLFSAMVEHGRTARAALVAVERS